MHLPTWVPDSMRAGLARLRTAQVWIVGGAVLDWLDHRSCRELDVVTTATATQLRGIGAVPIGGGHDTHRIGTKDGAIEISPLAGSGLNEDLARRDFTIHAMALRWPDGLMADPFGGRRDRERRLLRCPRREVDPFAADPVRLLRALRRLAQGYRLEAQTASRMLGATHRLAAAPPERIGRELEKLLLAPFAGRALAAASRWPGLLAALDPTFAAMAAARPPEGHRWSPWRHSCILIDAVDPNPVLRWAALLHDAGKVLHGDADHAVRSAAFADRVLTRWGIERRTRLACVRLIAAHTIAHRQLVADAAQLRIWAALNRGQEAELIAFRRGDRRAAGWARPGDDLDTWATRVLAVMAEDYPRRPSELAIDCGQLLDRLKVPNHMRARLLDTVWRWVLADPVARNRPEAIAAAADQFARQ